MDTESEESVRAVEMRIEETKKKHNSTWQWIWFTFANASRWWNANSIPFFFSSSKTKANRQERNLEESNDREIYAIKWRFFFLLSSFSLMDRKQMLTKIYCLIASGRQSLFFSRVHSFVSLFTKEVRCLLFWLCSIRSFLVLDFFLFIWRRTNFRY